MIRRQGDKVKAHHPRHRHTSRTRQVVFFLSLLVTLSLCLRDARSSEPSGDWKSRLAKVKVELFVAAPGYCEGPSWRDGELFFCSTGLLRVTRDHKLRLYLDVSPSGTYLSTNGHILICDNKVPALLDVAPDGTIGVVVEKFDNKKLNSLNDVTVDRDGNVYWTDPSGSSREHPIGCIFRVAPDGKVDRLADDLAFPNGLEVDPQNRYLYVIESRTAKILRYDLPPRGKPLGKPIVFFALGGSGGDGCAFDAAGNFWIADFHRSDTKKGRITVLNPEARVLGHLPIPAGQVSNLTFGGPKYDELFVTTGDPDAVFHARVGVSGFKGFPAKPLKILRRLDLKPLDEPLSGK
jgi:gluconolactonase